MHRNVVIALLLGTGIASAAEPVGSLGAARMRHPGRWILGLCFSPDGKLLASHGEGPAVALWDTTTGKLVRTLTVGEHTPYVGQSNRSGADFNLVGSVAFSANGKLLAAGGNGGVYLWETDGWQLRHRLHTDGQTGLVAFAPDSKTVAALDSKAHDLIAFVRPGEPPPRFSRWDVVSGKEVERVRCPSITDRALMLPDTRHIAVREYRDYTVVRTDTGTQSLRLRSAFEAFNSPASFSPDGKLLVRHDEGGFQIWDVEKGKEIKRVPGYQPAGLAVASGGKKLFSFAMVRGPDKPRGEMYFIGHDVETGKELFRNPDVRPRLRDVYHANLAVSPDGKMVASETGTVIDLWDATTGNRHELAKGDAPAQSATILRFSPDGKVVVTLSEREQIARIWDVASGKVLFQVPGKTRWLALLADGKRLATRDDAEIDVHLWEVPSGKEAGKLPGRADHYPEFASFIEDGKRLVTLGHDGKGTLWDVQARKQIKELTVPFRGGLLDVTADGKLLLVSSQSINRFDLWDLEKERMATSVTLSEYVARYEGHPETILSSNARILAGVDANRLCFWVWNVEKGGWLLPVAPVRMTKGAVIGLSEEERLLAIAHASHGLVRLFDVDTGKERGSLMTSHSGIVKMTFLPGGKQLLTSGSDGSLLIWDLTKLEPARPARVTRRAVELRRLWDGQDVAQAPSPEGFWAMVEAGPEAVLVLRERLKPVPSDAVLPRFPPPTWRVAQMALQVLEFIDSDELRKLLEQLATGNEEALLTQHAKAALKRLAQRR